jgi:protein-disulfide isomerase
MANRREQQRRELEERLARETKARRQRNVIAGVVVAVVLAAAVGIGLAVQGDRSAPAAGDPGVAAPAGVSAGGVPGAFVVGNPDAPVTVTVYEDFQCPACKQLEQLTGPTLAGLRDAGTVKVAYHPIAFLDEASTTDYSSRALNAAACLLDQHPEGFQQLHDALFAEQPAEGTAGLTDARLTELVAAAGAPGATACLSDRQFGDWVRQVTEQSSVDGVRQTPTVRVNGKDVDNPTPDGLTAAVRAAGRS